MLYPERLKCKAKDIPFETVKKDLLLPSPENVLLLSHMLLSRKQSDDIIATAEIKAIKKRREALIGQLNIKEKIYLKNALSLIDGEIGDSLRQTLYPYFYKNCPKDTSYKSVQEILKEATAFAKLCLKNPEALMRYCGMNHLEKNKQLSVITDWLSFLETRNNLVTQGKPVELSRWFTSIVHEDIFVMAQSIPDKSLPFFLGMSNAIEAFPGMVQLSTNNYTTKYCYLPNILASQALFFCENGSVEANNIKAKLGFESDKASSILPYEVAQLEFQFLQGRIPHMTPIAWKSVPATPSLNRVIPSLQECEQIIIQMDQMNQVEEMKVDIDESHKLSGIENGNDDLFTDEELDFIDPKGKMEETN